MEEFHQKESQCYNVLVPMNHNQGLEGMISNDIYIIYPLFCDSLKILRWSNVT